MIYPMFCLVLLTFIVALVTIKARVASVKSGQLKIKYFRLMQGEEVSELVTKTTRCFNNMFEVPVLFYVGCIMSISTGADGIVGLVLAWLFVVFRCLQAFIHITYNNVLHRMVAFWCAFMSVMGLWLNLMWAQL